MPVERTIAPIAASGRGGKPARAAAAPVIGALDEDAEMVLFTVGNRGELPGEYSQRPLRPLEEDQPQPPYWATWGF
jgi:hypothetical protein